MLQSCLCNSPWPWRWATNESESILKCSKQYSSLWRSLPLKHQSYRTLLARNLEQPWLPCSIPSAMGMISSCSGTLEARHSLQPLLSTLVRLRFPVSEPLSFPIYHILVIIFHPTQAALLLYVDSHRNSDPKSLERSRGTLTLMETRGYKWHSSRVAAKRDPCADSFNS